jgi:hypothetical protein
MQADTRTLSKRACKSAPISNGRALGGLRLRARGRGATRSSGDGTLSCRPAASSGLPESKKSRMRCAVRKIKDRGDQHTHLIMAAARKDTDGDLSDGDRGLGEPWACERTARRAEQAAPDRQRHQRAA